MADGDGLPLYYPDDFTFQWVRIDSSDNETVISGATSHQYRLVAADEDHTVKVKVSFTDRAGSSEGPLVSPATGTIAGRPTGTGVGNADALVSNLSRSDNGNGGNVGNFIGGLVVTQAIGFTTGSNRDGYELRSIRAVLDFADSSDGVRARIFSADGTTPDSSVATLTNPTIGNGVKEFTAPADTILDKDTLYFVVFDATTSNGAYSVSLTDSDTTITAAAGWSLNTQRHQKNSDSGDWSTRDAAVLVEINGGAVLNTFPVFTDGASATRSIEENLGSATDTSARNVGDPVAATDADSGDALTYSLVGTDAAKFDIDSSTGQIKTKAGQNYDHQGDGTLSVTVSVTDGLDTVSIPVTIYITDHPTPESPLAPAAPTVRGTDLETLSVRWGAPSNAGRPAIGGYDLRYREGTSGSWTDGPQDVTGTSAQIMGLVENTAYEAQVRAQNADGDGPWSPAGSGTTGASATRSLEENLGSATDTSARNVGDPVVATDADSGDTLTYSLEGTNRAKFDIDSSTGQIKTKVGQNYDHEGGALSVTVLVTDGDDTVSIPVTIDITDHPTPEPPLAPAAPTVRGSGTESLAVSWGPPGNAGRPAIGGYDLRYREGTSGSWTDGPQDVTETSAQLSGLVANTAYEVQVRAQNADGDGPWSPAGTGSTYHPGTPGGVLLETTLITGPSSRQGSGCSSSSNYECADAMNPSNGFVSTDTGGVAKTFGIGGLQLDRIVRSGYTDRFYFHIWFEGVRELRDYEVENLGVEVTVGSDVYRFWFRDADAGGYHLRSWRGGDGEPGVDMRWELNQTLPIRILDRRTFPDSSMANQAQPLTAEFSDAPETHDGSTAFTFRLAFSDDVDIEPAEMRDHALTVTDATVTNAARVDGRSDLWELTVEPAGTADVGILVPTGRACTEQGALCTADGRSLSVAPALSIAHLQSQPPQGAALTAEFRNVPPEHDGSNGFTFRLAFSEAPEVTFRTLRDQALSASGGTVQRARRVVQGQNDLWEIRVEPSGNGAVTVTLGPSPACGESGAICTSDGTPLSGTATATIEGPSLPALSIADDEAQEGPNAYLRFEITLSEASDDPVTFDIATSDGTAIAGTDYIAKSRSKTIAAGRTTAWFRINVIDDAIDEGDETFTVTISNVTGATVADGTAIGTIQNSDAMPQAWLARFGRTVADQVLDAVDARMSAARTGGTELTLGGQPIGGAAAVDEEPETADAEAGLETLADWLQGGNDDDALSFESRAVTERELLTGSSFSLAGGSAESGFGALWGRAAVSSFDGREDDLTLDGEVTSAMLGADWSLGRGSAGLILSHSRGEGGYRSEAGDGEVESTLTGVYPWGRYALSESLALWGVVGYGSGELVLTPEGMDPIETDMALRMAAVGGRSVLMAAPAAGGLELAATSDAMIVQTSSDAVRGGPGNLAASDAEVTRLRLGLEGTWRLALSGEAGLTPSVEIGLRQDGGDAETGFGADIGAGLAWTDPSQGIAAEVRARGLLTHDEGGFRERGFAGSLAWDPEPASERGPSLTIRQTVGADASGGMDALLNSETARLFPDAREDGDDLQQRRLEARLGYGLSSFGGRYTATPEIRFGFSDTARETILGWRLAEERSAGLAFGVDIEGARHERVAGDAAPEHRLGLGFGWRLKGSGPERFDLRFEGARLDAANDDAPEYRLGVRMTARW